MDITWSSFHLACLVFLTALQKSVGNVKIILPYYPLYIKSSETLSLVCNTQQRLGLQWVLQTPRTSGIDTVVVPTIGSDFVIRNLTEEPSGYREITLIKKNMDINDRGVYICKDTSSENTFPLWITVLKITKTADFRPAQNSNDFILNCNITGFINNLPDIQYQWSFNNQSIPRTSDKYIYGTWREGKSYLNVTNPVPSDSGVYECSFILTTDNGPLSFTEAINVDGKVEIVKPYYPLYVKSGEALSLVCHSQERLALQWVRQTPNTSWRDTLVVPTVGSDFITRVTREEPSGYSEITLTKKNMDIYDRGMYMCRDVTVENTFAVWVTVLKITKTTDIHLAQNIKHFLLHCNVSGFDNNLPEIQYQWSLNNQSIPSTHRKYVYGMSEDGKTHLNVTNPVQSDLGVYECTFVLTTNLGPLAFTEAIKVKGEGLLSKGDAIHLHKLTLACVILVLLRVFIL